MSRIRPSWRLIATVLLLLGVAAVGLRVAVPNASERQTPVSPYDPMPRW